MEPKPLDNVPAATSGPSMDDLTQGEVFPEVKQNAIDAVAQANAEKLKEQQENIAAGVKLKKDGTPAKKRGRKAGSTLAGEPKPQGEFYKPSDNAKAQPAGTVSVDSIYAATVTSGIIEQATIKLISPKFELHDMERQGNIKAWKDLFDASGGVHLTPAQAVMLSHASIIGTRLATDNETKNKMRLFGAWAKLKISGMKNALSNRRKNSKRQDNVGEEKSGEPEKTSGPKDNSPRPVPRP